MTDISSRIQVIEDRLDDHAHDIQEVKGITKQLDERVKAQQKFLDDMRDDQKEMRKMLSTNFDRLQTAMDTLTREALNSQPKWAADNAEQAALQARNDSRTKGVLAGIAVTLLGIVVTLIIDLVAHGAL